MVVFCTIAVAVLLGFCTLDVSAETADDESPSPFFFLFLLLTIIYPAEKNPKATIIIVSNVQTTSEKAVPSALGIPNKDNANITAKFQGPNPPFEGIPIEIELKTKTTKPGIRPYAVPCLKIKASV